MIELAVAVAVGVMARLAYADVKRCWPAPEHSAFDEAVAGASTEEIEPPPSLVNAQRLVGRSGETDGDVHRRLRPVVRELADDRLRADHDFDLASEPDRARALLAGPLWELVRPDRPEPADRFSGGMPHAELTRIIEQLEGL